MSKSGPIVIIEDDRDDRDFLEKIFLDLKVENQRIWFEDTDEAMNYLLTTSYSTFVIISDVNLPGQNGLDFKRAVDSNDYLRKKSIPFIFYSTSTNQQLVNSAYAETTIQGFFRKEDSYESAKNLIHTLLEYWKLCKHPNM